MKVVIAGSRTMGPETYEALDRILRALGWPVSEVVSGGARGADALGEAWAVANGVPVRRFLADWQSYGRAAGAIRNLEMRAYGDALVALWDGESPGTRHMISAMRSKVPRVPVVVCVPGVTGITQLVSVLRTELGQGR